MARRPSSWADPLLNKGATLFEEDSRAALSYCANQSKRADRALWRAAHYARPETRSALIALHAFAIELDRIPMNVSESSLAEMRLVWWRQGVEAIRGALVPGVSGPSVHQHPVIKALAPSVQADPVLQDLLGDMIMATGLLLDPSGLVDRTAIDSFLRVTYKAFVQSQMRLLGESSSELAGKAQDLACLYGFLHRALMSPAAPSSSSILPHRSQSSGSVINILIMSNKIPFDSTSEIEHFATLRKGINVIPSSLMPVFTPFSVIPRMIKKICRKAEGVPISQEQGQFLDHILMTRTVLRGKL